jgi:hypothetical protein
VAWNYEGSPIEVVSQYKQLIMLTSNCKWQAQGERRLQRLEASARLLQ